jgi:hypothetical protein
LKIGGRKFEDFPLESITPDDLESLRKARRAELMETDRLYREGKTTVSCCRRSKAARSASST